MSDVSSTSIAVLLRSSMLGAALVLALAACGASTTRTTATRQPSQSAARAAGVSRGATATLQLTATTRLPAAVQLPAVAAYADGALASGGLDAQDASVASIVRVGSAGAHRLGVLPQALHDAAAANIDGHVYFFGGGNAASASTAILRVQGAGTRVVGRLPAPSSDVAAATLGHTAYVVGGYTELRPLRTIVGFTPGSGAHVVGMLPRALRYAAVAAVDGRLLIAGGTSGATAQRAILSFDPATGAVRQIGSLPRALTHAAGATLNGRFYLLGGRTDNLTGQRREILAIDPVHGSVQTAGELPRALSDLGAASLPDRILLVGGRDSTGRVHDRVLTFTPNAGSRRRVSPVAGIPPLLDPHNVYAADRAGLLSPTVRRDPALVYVPNSKANTVDVISQRSFKVVAHFAVGALPQHITPSWDLRTLYVTNDTGNSLTPIDPRSGRPGRPIPVLDPYNLYFTADGRYAIVVAEAHRELDFRDAHTMALHHALKTPECAGVDHMDFTADGRYALVSCEFAGRMIVVDLGAERVVKQIELSRGAMPQDVKVSPDGRTFYVADMASNGVWLIDAKTLTKTGFLPTGAGAHGLYPSRDAKSLYVSNRMDASISVISFATRRVIHRWRLPGGGSPDMGGVSASGRVLWLSGRYNGEVYAISTTSGRLLHRIKVGAGPHGLCVWPQPGRYSIGHTGILR
ncbi:MAG TPA: hypothetical protein VLJ42_00415 [Solirubrobacteraceae bacterium]|nr:hypothetical protein [Solirubrobacteraceae bacterium]